MAITRTKLHPENRPDDTLYPETDSSQIIDLVTSINTAINDFMESTDSLIVNRFVKFNSKITAKDIGTSSLSSVNSSLGAASASSLDVSEQINARDIRLSRGRNHVRIDDSTFEVDNVTLFYPNANGTIATEEYVQEVIGGTIPAGYATLNGNQIYTGANIFRDLRASDNENPWQFFTYYRPEYIRRFVSVGGETVNYDYIFPNKTGTIALSEQTEIKVGAYYFTTNNSALTSLGYGTWKRITKLNLGGLIGEIDITGGKFIDEDNTEHQILLWLRVS